MHATRFLQIAFDCVARFCTQWNDALFATLAEHSHQPFLKATAATTSAPTSSETRNPVAYKAPASRDRAGPTSFRYRARAATRSTCSSDRDLESEVAAWHLQTQRRIMRDCAARESPIDKTSAQHGQPPISGRSQRRGVLVSKVLRQIRFVGSHQRGATRREPDRESAKVTPIRGQRVRSQPVLQPHWRRRTCRSRHQRASVGFVTTACLAARDGIGALVNVQLAMREPRKMLTSGAIRCALRA